ncbi:hypothetical protein KAT80_01680 [Candidatus Pacearchaeota archaeon]|nr:hypothetical protein [Candidatus Pacearchaeota archaeon]
MVKINNVSEERLAKEKRRERTSGLLKEVFGDKVEVRIIPIGIELKEKDTGIFIGYVSHMQSIMELEKEEYGSEAIEFGKRFEKEIGVLYPNLVKHFIIETDYR